MKKLITTCIFLLGLSLFAQEAGKAGELLKNEASQSEMQTQRSEVLRNNSEVLNKDNRSNTERKTPSTNRGTNSHNSQNIDYRWHQNYGYSEVFLRIPENGYFTVEIGNQMISNNSGKFRFFDLNPGKVLISIYEDGYLIYKTRVNIQKNRRLILDFFTHQGLYLLDSYPVQNQTYGFNEWDDVWNNPYGSFGNNYNTNSMNNAQFTSFLNALKKNSFDDSKLAFVQQQLRSTVFSAQQIKTILETFSFDSERLNAGKVLYTGCIDKQNFYIVYEVFSHDSYQQELMLYISKFG